MRRVQPMGARHQRGLAFVLVLWVVAMLTILLGSFSLIARTENLQARHMFDTTQARYAAEAGLNLAVYELRKADPMLRWVGDGRPYTFGFGEAEVEVRITDDSGKLNLNSADPATLTNLFVARGVAPDRAEALAAAIRDWVDGDVRPRPTAPKRPTTRRPGWPMARPTRLSPPCPNCSRCWG